MHHFVILSSLVRMHHILSIYYTGIRSNEFHLPFFIYIYATLVHVTEYQTHCFDQQFHLSPVFIIVGNETYSLQGLLTTNFIIQDLHVWKLRIA